MVFVVWFIKKPNTHKVLVKCGPHEDPVFNCFKLYNPKCDKPSKAQVFTQFECISNYILRVHFKLYNLKQSIMWTVV